MTELSKIREEFIEATCPDGASQSQINDMGMAFDAGSTVVLQMVLEIASMDNLDKADAKMMKLSEEVMSLETLHT